MTHEADPDPVIQFRMSDKLTIVRLETKMNLVLALGSVGITVFGAILAYLIAR